MDKISQQTVFILGAGASAAYGYPTGAELREWIIRRSLPADTTLDADKYRAFQNDLKKAPFSSVDAFLEKRQECVPFGKQVIAEWLIRCEIADNLSVDERTDWLRTLLEGQLLDCAFDRIAAIPFSFVTFNYDRSLDAKLFEVLKATYGKSDEETAQMCGMISVIHVHGSLGPIPGNRYSIGLTRPYSPIIKPHFVTRAADGIKVMHESVDDSEEFKQARSLLKSARRIRFLGFGFHPANLRRLNDNYEWPPGIMVSGTAYQVDEYGRSKIEENYSKLGKWPRPALRNKDCDITQYLYRAQDL